MNYGNRNNKRRVFYPLFYSRWWVVESLRPGSPQRVKWLDQKIFTADYYPSAAVLVRSLLDFMTAVSVVRHTESSMHCQNPIAPQHCQQRHYTPAVSSSGGSPTAAL